MAAALPQEEVDDQHGREHEHDQPERDLPPPLHLGDGERDDDRRHEPGRPLASSSCQRNVAAAVAFALAVLISITLHELVHAVVGLLQGGSPVLSVTGAVTWTLPAAGLVALLLVAVFRLLALGSGLSLRPVPRGRSSSGGSSHRPVLSRALTAR